MKKFDIKLICLCILVFLVCFIKYFMPSFYFVEYLCLAIHIFIIFIAKEDEYIPIVLFNHTCSSLYDDIGFKYIFNITFMIFILKLLFFDKAKFEKKTICLLIILFLYEMALTIINIGINSSIFSLFTLFGSYIFVILIINKPEYINKSKIFKYFFVGFLISALAGYMYPISKWGTSIPLAYRYKGLLRDSNYYSIDALLIMLSSMYEKKKITKEAIIIFIVGLLAVSKMFILVSIVSFFLFALYSIFNLNDKKKTLKFLIMFFAIPIVLYFVLKTEFISTIINKYVYRTDSDSLLTGREYIYDYYGNQLINNPINLIFGKSTNYALVLGIGTDIDDSFYSNIVAHNTYLDLILSWGIFGSCIYVFLLYLIQNEYKKRAKIIKSKINVRKLIFCGVIMVCLFVLSYLMLDFMSIMILYIIIFINNRDVIQSD